MNTDTDTDVRFRMISGAWYNPAELAQARLAAQTRCRAYNALPPADQPAREACLRDFLGEFGIGSIIEQPFHCDYGFNIHLGDRCFLNYGCTLLDCAPITFGNHVLCGPDCGFYTAIHPLDPTARLTDIECAKPIYLADNVWIGGHVTILPGVSIGKNTVVGAGSVVTHDLPANVIAAGNPARIIRPLPEP